MATLQMRSNGGSGELRIDGKLLHRASYVHIRWEAGKTPVAIIERLLGSTQLMELDKELSEPIPGLAMCEARRRVSIVELDEIDVIGDDVIVRIESIE